MPLSRPGSAKTAASVCLYSVYRKQERSLFTSALEQTSNVPTARNVGRSSGRVRRRACGLPYLRAGRRSRPPSRSQQVFHQTKQKATCPKLAEVARHVLAGPAASTLSERSFPIAGRTIEDRRTQLSAEFVDGLMFLHGLAE